MKKLKNEIEKNKSWGLKILQDKAVRYVFGVLYIKACKEQALKDNRIYSDKMREIEVLKKWYFSS